jgi:PAS domain S-box-containing protein
VLSSISAFGNVPRSDWRQTSGMAARGLACVAVVLATLLLLRPEARPEFILPGSGVVVLAALLYLHTRPSDKPSSRDERSRLPLEIRSDDLRSLIDGSFDAIVIIDKDLVCREANHAFARLLNIDLRSVIGRRMDQFLWDSGEASKLCSQSRKSSSQQGWIDLIRADGARIQTEFSARRSQHSGQHLLVLRDPTELVRAEEMKCRSLATARSRAVECQILRSAMAALSRRDPLNVVLDRLLRILHASVPYQTGHILLLEAPGKLLPVREISWTESGDRRSTLDGLIDCDSYPVLRQIIDDRRGVLISEARKTDCDCTLPENLAAGAWFGVPLFAGNEALGILSLTHGQGGYWTQEHLRLATTFATLVSLAVYQTRLDERAEIYRSELEGGLRRGALA